MATSSGWTSRYCRTSSRPAAAPGAWNPSSTPFVALVKSTRPKLLPGRHRRLQPGEEARLLAACSSTLAPAVRFALETAMRRSEIAELRWEHVNIKVCTVRLPLTKNGEVRTVPLSSMARDVLRALPRRLDGSMFGLRAKTITEAFEWAVQKAGIEDLTFHDRAPRGRLAAF